MLELACFTQSGARPLNWGLTRKASERIICNIEKLVLRIMKKGPPSNISDVAWGVRGRVDLAGTRGPYLLSFDALNTHHLLSIIYCFSKVAFFS